MNTFWSMTYLEPRCKNCESKVDYGATTRWDDNLKGHICLSCENPLELKEQDQVYSWMFVQSSYDVSDLG